MSSSMPLRADYVSTILRFHDPSRVKRLELALMSLCGQRYPFLSPVILLQDFSDDEEASVRNLALRLPWGEQAFKPEVINLRGLGPGDHRTKLLNAGLKAATGQYIGFLDFDDYLYPNAYSRLIERIKKSGKKSAFGAVQIAEMTRTLAGACIAKRTFPTPNTKYHFFTDNIYPIHSFLIESEIAKTVSVPENLSALEDYYFLLSILSQHDWDDELIRQAPIADYVQWADDSNTINGACGTGEKGRPWIDARREIDRFKQELRVVLPLSTILPSSRDSSLALSDNGQTPDMSFAFIRSVKRRLPIISLLNRIEGGLKTISWDGNELKVRGWLKMTGSRFRPVATLVFLARKSRMRPSYRYAGASSIQVASSGEAAQFIFDADFPLRGQTIKKGRDHLAFFILTDDGRLYRAGNFERLRLDALEEPQARAA